MAWQRGRRERGRVTARASGGMSMAAGLYMFKPLPLWGDGGGTATATVKDGDVAMQRCSDAAMDSQPTEIVP